MLERGQRWRDSGAIRWTVVFAPAIVGSGCSLLFDSAGGESAGLPFECTPSERFADDFEGGRDPAWEPQPPTSNLAHITDEGGTLRIFADPDEENGLGVPCGPGPDGDRCPEVEPDGAPPEFAVVAEVATPVPIDVRTEIGVFRERSNLEPERVQLAIFSTMGRQYECRGEMNADCGTGSLPPDLDVRFMRVRASAGTYYAEVSDDGGHWGAVGDGPFDSAVTDATRIRGYFSLDSGAPTVAGSVEFGRFAVETPRLGADEQRRWCGLGNLRDSFDGPALSSTWVARERGNAVAEPSGGGLTFKIGDGQPFGPDTNASIITRDRFELAGTAVQLENVAWEGQTRGSFRFAVVVGGAERYDLVQTDTMIEASDGNAPATAPYETSSLPRHWRIEFGTTTVRWFVSEPIVDPSLPPNWNMIHSVGSYGGGSGQVQVEFLPNSAGSLVTVSGVNTIQ